uniref:aminodeoxychorismate synthase component I n=1 Tax=Thaumasiovibrio occultus TaxID=1891184 RepID=UPI000B357C5A|nr:aminodeoxychorismate synthase component I [Thaumasiovibrio occultus]
MPARANASYTTQSLKYEKHATKKIFSQIAHNNWAMLLRSASRDHSNSRFDILVADPIVTVTTYAGCSTVKTPESEFQDHANPFHLLTQLQTQWLHSALPNDDLPFLGGVLGYWSYDLGRVVEKMPSLAEHDIPAPEMAVGLYNWALIADHQKKTLTLVNQNPEFDRLDWLLSQVAPDALPCSLPFALTQPWQSNMTAQSYADKFTTVKEYIVAGDCYQINLAQRFDAAYQGDEWQAYEKLEAHNQAPFSAFIRIPEHTVLSVSPERFISLDNRVIETKPIKGTRPRAEDPAQDAALANSLLTAEKDRAENLMIVDLLRNDVGRVAKPGSVHVPHLFEIESFPAVHHLVSTIRATLDDQYRAIDLLRAAFPGGSITGAPKVRAMEIIEELEPHRRSVYCGSVGYISNCGKMDTSITIRTLISSKNRMYAWAGGGLVADSECDSEYQEIRDKLSRILPVLEN